MTKHFVTKNFSKLLTAFLTFGIWCITFSIGTCFSRKPIYPPLPKYYSFDCQCISSHVHALSIFAPTPAPPGGAVVADQTRLNLLSEGRVRLTPITSRHILLWATYSQLRATSLPFCISSERKLVASSDRGRLPLSRLHSKKLSVLAKKIISANCIFR
jgi:hypothetical protein